MTNWKELRQKIAGFYIHGEGIEIGALAQPLLLTGNAKVRYVDLLPSSELKKLYHNLPENDFVNVDIIDNGERLDKIKDATQDFVIANHFLEHCQDPIAAVHNMLRVVKPGGIIYLAIPDKNYTFDRDRPVTPLEHYIKDFEEGPEWSCEGHYEEVIRLIEHIDDDKQVLARKKTLMDSGYSIHFHVWSQFEMMEFITFIKRKYNLSFKVELFLANEFEVIIILRRTE